MYIQSVYLNMAMHSDTIRRCQEGCRVPRKKPRIARPSTAPLELYVHQQEVEKQYTDGGMMRFFLAWHRRAGKDVFGLNFAVKRALERVGSYWHMFPFHVQARRAIWNGIDARTGQRFIDRAFPDSIKESENDTEMSITLKNGSTWQMLGSDNYDRLVGANPAGFLLSEWALSDPAAWEYIRPILVENKGWAMFITTFRGRNHAWRMYQTVKDSPNWYCSMRTIEDTFRHDGKPIVSAADVEKEIKEGMSPALARQEFYLDVDAVNSGAIFANQHKILLRKQLWTPDAANKMIRVSWGFDGKGIAAVVHQDFNIIAVHPFVERNIVDCVQSVARRHNSMHMVHSGVDLDLSLFSELDGQGAINVPEPNIHMQEGRTAAALNICNVTGAAKETLADFAMSYCPHRTDLNDVQTYAHAAIAQALMVMYSSPQEKPWGKSSTIDYSKYDRGVI